MRQKRLLLALVVLLIIAISGCARFRAGSRVHIGFIFVPVSSGLRTEKVYTHDDHIHDEFCGHPRKWYDGRWVYFYNGYWEFYDYDEKVYYYIPSELIEDADD